MKHRRRQKQKSSVFINKAFPTDNALYKSAQSSSLFCSLFTVQPGYLVSIQKTAGISKALNHGQTDSPCAPDEHNSQRAHSTITSLFLVLGTEGPSGEKKKLVMAFPTRHNTNRHHKKDKSYLTALPALQISMLRISSISASYFCL